MAECLEILASKEVGLNDNQWPSRFAYPLLARCKKESLVGMSNKPFHFMTYPKKRVISMIILNTKSCEKIIRKIDVQELVSFMRLVQLSLPSRQVHHSEIRLSCLTFLVQFHLTNPPEELLPDELRSGTEENKKRRILEKSHTNGPFKIKRHA